MLVTSPSLNNDVYSPSLAWPIRHFSCSLNSSRRRSWSSSIAARKSCHILHRLLGCSAPAPCPHRRSGCQTLVWNLRYRSRWLLNLPVGFIVLKRRRRRESGAPQRRHLPCDMFLSDQHTRLSASRALHFFLTIIGNDYSGMCFDALPQPLSTA